MLLFGISKSEAGRVVDHGGRCSLRSAAGAGPTPRRWPTALRPRATTGGQPCPARTGASRRTWRWPSTPTPSAQSRWVHCRAATTPLAPSDPPRTSTAPARWESPTPATRAPDWSSHTTNQPTAIHCGPGRTTSTESRGTLPIVHVCHMNMWSPAGLGSDRRSADHANPRRLAARWPSTLRARRGADRPVRRPPTTHPLPRPGSCSSSRTA